MGFFDIIEQIQTSELETPPQEATGCQDPQPREDFNPRQSGNDRSGGKPETLALLAPCRICGSRDFFFTLESSFSCSICHPEETGRRVKAAGDIPPCPNRPDLQDDPDILAPSCSQHQFVAMTPAIDDHAGSGRNAIVPSPYTDCHSEPEHCLDHSRAWLEKHMPELQKAGWTIEEIYKRCTTKWPYGSWGVAYLPPWNKKNVTISINSHTGAIVFTTSGANGYKITQSAYPQKSVVNIRNIDTEPPNE